MRAVEEAVRRPVHSSLVRHALEILVLSLCLLLILRQWGVEPYEVPTGSMAPALAGHHRACDCPRCGYPVVVGRHPRDRGTDTAPFRCYRGAFCPNCGRTGLDLHEAPHRQGDQVLVNRNVYAFRRPRRWELIVFRLFGVTFIKRLVGLPGEEVEICDGDLYLDGALLRKSLTEFNALRLPLFDNDFQPQPEGWRRRWEVVATDSGPHPLAGTVLTLDGEGDRERYRLLTYANYQLDAGQCQPINDEYAYNGSDRGPRTLVHDFMMEARVEVQGDAGWVLFGITDGHDHLVAEIPVGAGEARLRAVRAWPPTAETLAEQEPGVLRAAHDMHLEAGTGHRVELAFVDRRLTLAIDGTLVFAPLDLPAVRRRPGVVRPAVLGARGVKAVVRNFRLFRDIHYTSAGPNAAPGKPVLLGPDQYFVLGDNSPNSQDSRFWPDGGVVPARGLLGQPFVVHVPGRAVGGAGAGADLDWGRVHWLR